VSSVGVGDLLTLRIEKPVAGGRMLARADGAVVLVAAALPGELVEARVERSQRGTLWAQACRVIEPSPDRVGEPDPCGGCVLSHARYDHQLAIKQQIVQDTFTRVARLSIEPPPIVPSLPSGYRMRARLHALDGRTGFFLEGTHTLCDAVGTQQLLPETHAAIDACMAGLGDEAAGVVAIDVAENVEASERALHVEFGSGAAVPRRAAAPPGVTSLSVSRQGSRDVEVWSGEGRVTDTFSGGGRQWRLSRSTRAFFQGNRHLLHGLVGHVVGAIGPGAVMDLYAGVGLFAVAAAAHGRAPVMAVEGDALSAADLRRNTAEWRGLVQARHASVEESLHDRRVLRPQTLVVDPPRTGLSRRALQGILALGAPRVIYVSCDVPTLARDARALVDAGYQLRRLTAFDLFPQTAHVETVAVVEL
jgi:23S rRNA (uracil1939-C5)-methyltransferase